MSPEEAREQTVSILHGTMDVAGVSGWTVDAKGSPLPEPCVVNGADGVAFSLGASSTTTDYDGAAAVDRVVDYWKQLGIEARVVDEPEPKVFGTGGPLKAIAFSTAPTYAISVAGHCVPGNAFDYYSGYLPPDSGSERSTSTAPPPPAP